jgi:hypothetical protein
VVDAPSHSRHGNVHLSQIFVLEFLKKLEGQSVMHVLLYKNKFPVHSVQEVELS